MEALPAETAAGEAGAPGLGAGPVTGGAATLGWAGRELGTCTAGLTGTASGARVAAGN